GTERVGAARAGAGAALAKHSRRLLSPIVQSLLALQPFDELGPARLALRLRLTAAREDMGEIIDRLDRRMLGVHFAQHTAVVGSIAEEERIERDDGHGDEVERLCEIGR